MGNNAFIFTLFLVGVGGGAFIGWWFNRGRTEKAEEKIPLRVSEETIGEILDWLAQGCQAGVLDSFNVNTSAAYQLALYEWVHKVPASAVAYRPQISDEERRRLRKWFLGVLIFLITVGTICAVWVLNEAAKEYPRLGRLAIVSGILGSSIAAFRSTLQRRSNGLEDRDGNVAPGLEKKERFSDGMVVWFLGRPLLGGGVALLIYFGLKGAIFSTAVKEEILNANWKFVFYMTLVGLFAKSILDILLKAVKEVFHV